MKVGDLIKIKQPSIQRNEDRLHGYILKFDWFKSIETNIPTEIAHVYWDTGNVGWIAAFRIEVISESR